jgi:flagellar protein FliO/FliZ
MLVALITFSPQAMINVLAENTIDESVYGNLNKEQSEKSKDGNPIPNVQDEELEPNVGNDSLSVTAFDFIKMFIALAFVLMLIYVLLKFVTKRNQLFQQGKSIVNLGGTSLGQNKSIQLIKVGNRVLVVGVGESISLLKEIESEQEIRKFIEEFEWKQEQVMVSKNFLHTLTAFVNQSKKLNRVTKDAQSSFSTTFKDQLEKVKKERTNQLEEVKRKGLNKNE